MGSANNISPFLTVLAIILALVFFVTVVTSGFVNTTTPNPDNTFSPFLQALSQDANQSIVGNNFNVSAFGLFTITLPNPNPLGAVYSVYAPAGNWLSQQLIGASYIPIWLILPLGVFFVITLAWAIFHIIT